MKKFVKVAVLSLGILSLLPVSSAFAIYEEGKTPEYEEGKFYIMSAVEQTQGEKIVELAKEQMGKKYKWGGTTPQKGFDASGFTQYVFAKANIKLNRTSADQFKQGVKVEQKDLQPGDLVFYDTSTGKKKKVSFVGIYAGNNKVIAVTTSKGVTMFDMSQKYWASKYMGAKRIVN